MNFSSRFFIVAILVSLHDDMFIRGHASECPTAFEQHGHRCYKVMAQQASWPEAKLYCQVIGGDLARITTASEQTIIAGLVLKSYGVVPHLRFWLDGTDMLVSREWRWMKQDGLSVPFSYTNWLPGEPSFGDEACLEVRWDSSSRWNNLHCHVLLSFICQASAKPSGGGIMSAINGDVLKQKDEIYL